MKITKTRLKQVIREAIGNVLSEATELTKNNNNIIMFSDYAKKHIEGGHKEPGLGSIFADFDLSLVSKALGTIPLEGDGGVYSIEVPGVGYDLVLPMDEALQLPDAQKTVVTKEERGTPVKVVGIKTSKPLSGFLQNKLSVVVRPTKDMQYVPDDVKEQVADAVAQGRVYSVLSAWPGRGDVPPSSKWGEDWAVIIPDQEAGQGSIEENKVKITKTKLRQAIREAIGRVVSEDADASKVDPERFPMNLSDVDAEKAKIYVTTGTQDNNPDDDKIGVKPGFTAPVSSLDPSQSSMNIGKAMAMAIAMIRKSQGKPGMETGGNLGAFISMDNHIMDGHHRWIATAMVDPSKEVGGYQVNFPAKELIAILNAITKGKLGVPKGKEATGGFEQFDEAPVKGQLEKYMTGGVPGDFPISAEEVTAAIVEWTGVEDAQQALGAATERFIGNLGSVKPFKLPSPAPSREDMPVIDDDRTENAIDLTVQALQGGEIDVNEPYADVGEVPAEEQPPEEEEEESALQERFQRLAGILLRS